MKKTHSADSVNLSDRIDQWIERGIVMLTGYLKIRADKSVIQSLVQFVKFGLVGVTNTIISYVLNVFALGLLEPYGFEWDYLLANLFAFAVSVLWSFYWNNRFVFTVRDGQRRNVFSALLKTYISYGITGILLTNILSYLWVSVLQISKYVAPFINLIISVPVNFVINRKWAFKG